MDRDKGMKISYTNKDIEEQSTNLRRAKKDFPEKIAKKLHQTINFIEAATSLAVIKNHTPFHFHPLKGKMEGQYAIDIDGRKSEYRLILQFDGYNNEQIFGTPTLIEVIQIKEVSKHYE